MSFFEWIQYVYDKSLACKPIIGQFQTCTKLNWGENWFPEVIPNKLSSIKRVNLAIQYDTIAYCKFPFHFFDMISYCIYLLVAPIGRNHQFWTNCFCGTQKQYKTYVIWHFWHKFDLFVERLQGSLPPTVYFGINLSFVCK